MHLNGLKSLNLFFILIFLSPLDCTTKKEKGKAKISFDKEVNNNNNNKRKKQPRPPIKLKILYFLFFNMKSFDKEVKKNTMPIKRRTFILFF